MNHPIRVPGSAFREKKFLIRRGLFSLLSALCLLSSALSCASSGTEGASFLDIPVGAGPAALGGAYSALADDAYAPAWNPGGLGFLDSTQISGQHLAYLDTSHYEYAGVVLPLGKTRSGLGVSIQYLASGDVPGTDINGNPTGNFSGYSAAYNLAYGRSLSEKLALGLTGKIINAKIDDVSATAYAADLGSLYKLTPRLTLAATLTNLGSKLTFLKEGDSLPLAFHLGAAYQAGAHWLVSGEAIYRQTGLAGFHAGGEWRPLQMIAFRAGYRTDTTEGLSALAGLTVGMGLNVWGQELAYAWLPMGDLGNTNYFSLVLRFGQNANGKQNSMRVLDIKNHQAGNKNGEAAGPDRLMELLNESDKNLAETSPERVVKP